MDQKTTLITPRKRGPKTPEGKRRCSMNAIKHGRYARSFFVLRHEDQAEFEQFAETFVRRMVPADDVEFHLVRQLAFTEWRLLRVTQMDSSVLDHEFDARKTALHGAGHTPAPAATLAVATNGLLETTRLPVYLAARESQLLYARNCILGALRQLRKAYPLPGACPQLADPIDLKAGNSFELEITNSPQPPDSEALAEKPFEVPIP